MSMLEYDIPRKRQVNELLELKQELNARDNKKYEVKTICNNKVYTKEAIDKLPRLYYLVS